MNPFYELSKLVTLKTLISVFKLKVVIFLFASTFLFAILLTAILFQYL